MASSDSGRPEETCRIAWQLGLMPVYWIGALLVFQGFFICRFSCNLHLFACRRFPVALSRTVYNDSYFCR